jgi:glycerophosphoryl diester phosphodiesterase
LFEATPPQLSRHSLKERSCSPERPSLSARKAAEPQKSYSTAPGLLEQNEISDPANFCFEHCKGHHYLMTIHRRDFLGLVGSSVGMLAGGALVSPHAQRVTKSNAPATSTKILVAHRGASAYAPEHTLESYSLALKQGADFVEQDLQITRDNQLVCLHDLTLERTTNVKELFPTRFREEVAPRSPSEQGSSVTGSPVRRWYVSDFTVREIKELDAGSWFNPKFKGASVPTFQETINLVRGKAGLYPETKAPEVYGQFGFDMERLLIAALKKNHLGTRRAERHTPVIIQSFSPESLKKLTVMLSPGVPLVLLINEQMRTRWLTPAGLTEAKQFAGGIGPAKALLDKDIVMQAHALGLSVTPYTFRQRDLGRFKTLPEEMRYYLYELGVDALFTDNPDLFPRA